VASDTGLNLLLLPERVSSLSLLLLIFVYQILNSLDFFRELCLLFLTLGDESGQLFLNPIPFFVGSVRNFDDPSDVLPLLVQLLLEALVDFLKDGFFLPEIINILSHGLVLSYLLVELRISLL
jgi:hypothetical protein